MSKTVPVYREFFKEWESVLGEKIINSDLKGSSLGMAIESLIYGEGANIKLSKKIFGSKFPGRGYITKARSYCNDPQKGYTDFNIIYLINSLAYIGITLPEPRAKVKIPEKKVIILANEFIKVYMPDKPLLNENATEIKTERPSSDGEPKYDKKFVGHIYQGDEIDTCEFTYKMKNKTDFVGRMLIWYSVNKTKNVFPVEVIVEGKIFNEQFMALVYYGKLTPADHCGSTFMTFSDKKNLTGDFSGYFKNMPASRKECKGTIEFSLED